MKKLLEKIKQYRETIEEMFDELESDVIKLTPILMLEKENKFNKQDRLDLMPFCKWCGYGMTVEEFDSKICECSNCGQKFKYEE